MSYSESCTPSSSFLPPMSAMGGKRTIASARLCSRRQNEDQAGQSSHQTAHDNGSGKPHLRSVTQKADHLSPSLVANA